MGADYEEKWVQIPAPTDTALLSDISDPLLTVIGERIEISEDCAIYMLIYFKYLYYLSSYKL